MSARAERATTGCYRTGRGAAAASVRAVTNGAGAAGPLFARWRAQVVEALGEAREELDALNVFPVPDADTGTNVYLTVEAAAQAAEQAEAAGASLPEVGRAFVDGALRGARGNSGVILSQLLRAGLPLLLDPPAADDPVAAGKLLAHSLRSAADAAWAAVGEPVEGTILSVARAAADGAANSAGDAPVAIVLRAATSAAHKALARTPEQLDALREAGVVDAGAAALVVVLDSTERVFTGRVNPRSRTGRRNLPKPTPATAEQPYGGPAFEVMYLLDAPDDAISALRSALATLGDSLVVVGGDGLWNVHVHVDDAGAALEAGIAAGRPHRVVVNHLARCAGQHAVEQAGGRSVVTTAAGPGLADLFTRAGAVAVHGPDNRQPRTADLIEAVVACDAAEVVVLPNDRDMVAAAEAAGRQLRDRGIRVAVIPTHAQVQALASLAVHDPGRSFDDDVVQMGAAAAHTRHGAVTVATRRAMTMAGPCDVGDALGVVDGDFAYVGNDLAAVAISVVDRLLGGAGEMVTLVSGSDAPGDLVHRVEQHVRASRPDVDVATYDGGQVGYPLLLAVE